MYRRFVPFMQPSFIIYVLKLPDLLLSAGSFSFDKKTDTFRCPLLTFFLRVLLVIVRMDLLDRSVFCDVQLCELNGSLV